ncbi:MAG: Mur ligase domain-containing protein, partial [Burkholderiales bacterium]
MALREPVAVELADWLRQRLGAGARLRSDSRKIEPGDAFMAYPGERSDGRAHKAAALDAGAAVVLMEAQGGTDTVPD